MTFVCVCVSLQARAVSGIKGLFHRNPKQASLDSHAAALLSRKSPFGAHLLRRTASAPSKAPGARAKAQAQGLPDFSTLTTKDCGPGAGEPGGAQASQTAAAAAEGGVGLGAGAGAGAGDGTAPHSPWGGTNGQLHADDSKGKSPVQVVLMEARARAGRHRGTWSEPLKRAHRVRLPSPGLPLEERPGVFARVAVNGSGRVGVASNCIKCVIGTKESPEVERRGQEGVVGSVPAERAFSLRQERRCRSPTGSRQVQPQPGPIPQALAQPDLLSPVKPKPEAEALSRPVPIPLPRARDRARQTLGSPAIRPEVVDPYARGARSCSVPRRRFVSPTPPKNPAPPPPTMYSSLRTHFPPPPDYGSSCEVLRPVAVSNGLSDSDSDSSSCGSLSSLELPPEIPACLPDNRRRAAGTLQREMNALFAQKMEEIRSKSPLFFAGKQLAS